MSGGITANKFEWLKQVPQCDLSGSEWRVLLAIFNRTDGDGSGAYPSYDRLADDTDLPERTIRKALKTLRDTGLIVQEKRGGRDGSGASWASVYRLGDPSQYVDKSNLNRHEQGMSTGKNGVSQPARIAPPTEPLPDPLPDSEELRSPQTNAGPISRRWHINGSHVAAATAYGVNANEVGAVFKSWAAREGVRSRDFDAKFGKLLELVGHAESCPEDKGFAGISDHSESGEMDWYMRPPYRVATPPVAVPLTAPLGIAGQWTAETWPGSNACKVAASKAGKDYSDELTGFRARHCGESGRAIEFEKMFKSELVGGLQR